MRARWVAFQNNQFHNMLYENVRIYQIEQRISFCQNPDLNRRTDKTLI